MVYILYIFSTYSLKGRGVEYKGRLKRLIVCVCGGVVYMWTKCSQKPEGDNSEPSDVEAEDWTQVFYKST